MAPTTQLRKLSCVMHSLESKLEAAVVKACLKFGVQSVKLMAVRGAATGWPDRLFLLPNGRAIWLELKRVGGVATPLQLHRIETLRKLGHDAHVVDDAAQAVELVYKALVKARSIR